MNDDYLWDKSGMPDAGVRRLEDLLRRYRHGPLRARSLRPALRWAVRGAAVAACAAVAFVAWLALLPRFGQPGPEWEVTENGVTRLLRAGEELRPTGRAEVRAGWVGRIDVEPGSVLRLVATSGKRHRLALDRGRIAARIWSPPFTFSFATPAGVSYDLGCAFTLEASEREDMVRVTSGWVAFQWEDRQELIPAGAAAIALPGAGPGTPFFEDADDAFKSALRQLSFPVSGGDRASALRTALAHARPRDVYSLLRLALRAGVDERGLIYDRAAALVAPPRGLTREAFMAREDGVLDAWTHALGLGDAKRWWVHWRDALR